MSQKNIAKKAHARHYSHQKSHGSIAHSPTAHPITHKKKLHVIFKQTEVFAWWAKRYYECDKNFMKISHDENEKNLKIHDLTQYETFWLGKLRDKYAFQLKLKKDVECDVKQIILAGESDEQHSYALYKFFESATQAAVPTLSSQPSILTESISRGQSEAQEELPNAPSQVKEAPVRSQTEMLPEIPEGTRKRSISVGGKRKEWEPKASDTEECADKANLSRRLDSSIALNEDTWGINAPGKDNKDNITNLLGSPTLVDRLEERIARPSITPIRVIPPRQMEFSVPNDAPEWVEDVWEKCVKNNKMWKNMTEQKIDPEQWNLVHENGKFKIWQSPSKTNEFRCLYPVESGTSAEKLLQVLLDVPNKNKWDNACDKADILIYMPTCVIHQVNKPFARHSFPREFVYARYVCKTLGTYFIIDQSLDYTQIEKSANTPRGNIDYSIMHISTEGSQVYLNMLISVTNGGLANSTQDTQITLDSLTNIPHMSKVFDQYEEWDDFELAFMPGSELASRRESVAMNMRKSIYRAVRLEPEDPIIQENIQENMQESIITQNAEVVEIQNLMDCSNIVVPERGSIINREGESKLEEELIAMMSSSPKRDLSPAFGDDLLTLLEQARTQIPASQCVDSKIQTRPLTQQEACAAIELADNNVFNGKICKRDPENGLHFTNKEFLSKQISSESLLQRVSSSFCYGPQLLTLAGQQTNPLEAFKYVIAFYFSTLHTAIAQSKPFNPILGETYQGYLGGIPILCEQISCQPPISAIYMKTPDFFLYGSQQLDTSSGPNSATTTNKRRLCVTLEKLNMNIYAYFPMAVVSGTTFGNRYLNWAKRLKVYDTTNNLYCELLFNPDDEKGVISGLFSKKTADADGARGSIYKVKPEFIKALHKKEEANSSSRARFDPKEHALEEIVAVEGSWISYFEIGGNRIWDGQKMKPYKLIDQPNKTLASDANYREDVIYMKIGDLIKAQEANGKLENTQRVDKKLREKSGKSKL